MGKDPKGYYKLLGVPTDASLADIKKKYRELALKHHPDKNPNDRERASEKFKQLAQAYDVLSNPESRANYDRGGVETNYFETSNFEFHDAERVFEMVFGNNGIFGSTFFDDIFNNSFTSRQSNRNMGRRQRARNFNDFFDDFPPSRFGFDDYFNDDFIDFCGYDVLNTGTFQQMLSQQTRNFSRFNSGPVHFQSSVTCYSNGVGTTRVSKSVRDVNGRTTGEYTEYYIDSNGNAHVKSGKIGGSGNNRNNNRRLGNHRR